MKRFIVILLIAISSGSFASSLLIPMDESQKIISKHMVLRFGLYKTN
ncbi:MAG: hypothetical protein IPG08_08400 [Sphingobacteriaceae bacterium]|nr:hypothetical protein [Sphingobacteriaceae bacterium]